MLSHVNDHNRDSDDDDDDVVVVNVTVVLKTAPHFHECTYFTTFICLRCTTNSFDFLMF